jgi:predicted phosphodiesterase
MSHKPLDDYAAEQEQAAFAENQSIARANRTLRATLREREEELELVRKRLGIIEAMDAAVIAPPKWLAPPKRKGAKHVAIPSVMLNDIHWGEVVDPAEIAGVNKYNPTIAEGRVKRACEGTIKLCRDYMSGVDYEGLNVMLAGDLISGDIHDELRETNAEASTVVGVLEVLVAGLRMLADHFGRVHVAAVVGNHGRTTRKPRAKRKARDSFDGLVYQLIARELQGDDRITIQVATGSDLHFSVYDTRYALTHGDQFRGGSGISGALAPLMLGTHRKRKRDAQAGHPWDVLCMGHWHQSIYHGDLIVGGSVIGYNEYAYNLNLPIEDPVSALWLTTPERGRTTYNPVHLMDRQAEGW